MKKLLLLPLILMLAVSLVSGQGNPEFEQVPDDRTMNSNETIVLEWIVRNANGHEYAITVKVGDGSPLDAAKGEIMEDTVRYTIVSPPVGNLTINLLVETAGNPLNDTVVVTVNEDLGVDSTVETSVNTGNYPLQAMLASVFVVFAFRKKFRKL